MNANKTAQHLYLRRLVAIANHAVDHEPTDQELSDLAEAWIEAGLYVM